MSSRRSTRGSKRRRDPSPAGGGSSPVTAGGICWSSSLETSTTGIGSPLETELAMEDRIRIGPNGETEVEFLMLPREER